MRVIGRPAARRGEGEETPGDAAGHPDQGGLSHNLGRWVPGGILGVGQEEGSARECRQDPIDQRGALRLREGILRALVLQRRGEAGEVVWVEHEVAWLPAMDLHKGMTGGRDLVSLLGGGRAVQVLAHQEWRGTRG